MAYRACNVTDDIGSVKCARASGACHTSWKSYCAYVCHYSRTPSGEYTFTISIYKMNQSALCFIDWLFELNPNFNVCKDVGVSCVPRSNMCSCGCSHYPFSFRVMLERQAWLLRQPETLFKTQRPFANTWSMPSRR
jgi:hypothetical protein